MRIEILYTYQVMVHDSDVISGLTFADKKDFWEFKSKHISIYEALPETLKEFYKAMKKENRNVIPLQITFLDWI